METSKSSENNDKYATNMKTNYTLFRKYTVNYKYSQKYRTVQTKGNLVEDFVRTFRDL